MPFLSSFHGVSRVVARYLGASLLGILLIAGEARAADRPPVTLQANNPNQAYPGYLVTATQSESSIPDGDTVLLNLEPPPGQSGYWQYIRVTLGTSDLNPKSFVVYSPENLLAVSDNVENAFDVPVKRYDFPFGGAAADLATKGQVIYFLDNAGAGGRVSGPATIRVAVKARTSGTWKYAVAGYYRIPGTDDLAAPTAAVTLSSNAMMAGDDLVVSVAANAASGSVARVEIFNNETHVGDAEEQGSGVWRYTMRNVQADLQFIKAHVVDSRGRSAFSSSAAVYVRWLHAKINFGPPAESGTVLDAGYIRDTGQTFGLHQGVVLGERHHFGWSKDLVAEDALKRNGIELDERFDTYAKMSDAHGDRAEWEIQVPDGRYVVQLGAGDSGYGGERYRLQIEDVQKTVVTTNSFWSGWHEVIEVPVIVRDGRLTIRDIGNERPAKLNFVFIRQTGSLVAHGYSRFGSLRGWFPDTVSVTALSDIKVGVSPDDDEISTYDAPHRAVFYSGDAPGWLEELGLTEGTHGWGAAGASAVASFGAEFGSALYAGQTYAFNVNAGALKPEVGAAAPQFRIRVFTIARQYVGELDLPVNEILSSSSAGWNQALRGGLKKSYESASLGLTVGILRSYDDLSSVSPKWTFRISTTNPAYVYLLESDSVVTGEPALSLTRFASMDGAGHYTLGAGTYTPLLALNPEPAQTFSTKIKNYAFEGKLMPASYYGTSVEELANRNTETLRAASTPIIAESDSALNLAQFTDPAAPELLPFKQVGAEAATPELRRHTLLDEFVQRHDGDPISLANYVQNEIGLSDAVSFNQAYHEGEASIDAGGVQRGALGVLLEKQGSPAEQCALLIYFLRKCGIPAAYVSTTRNNVLMQDSVMSRMLKVRLNAQLSVPKLIPVNYPWVAALVPNPASPGEHHWVHLFPWIKDIELTEGLDLYGKLPASVGNGWDWVYKYFHAEPSVLPVQLRDPDGPGPSSPRIKQVYGVAPYDQSKPLPREYEDVAGRQDFDQPAVLWPRFIEWKLREVNASIDHVGYRARGRSRLFSRWEDFPLPTQVAGDFRALAGLKQIPRIFDTIQYQITSIDSNGADKAVLIDSFPLLLCDVLNRKIYVERYNVDDAGGDDVRLTMGSWDPLSAASAERAWPVANQLDSSNFSGGEARHVTKISDPGATLRVRIVHDRDRHNLSIRNTWLGEGGDLGGAYTPSFFIQNETVPGVQETDSNNLPRGVHALCVHVGRVTQDMLLAHLREIWKFERSSSSGSNSDISLGSKSFLMGMTYWSYLTEFSERLARLHKLTISSDYGHLFSGLGTNNVNGKPQLPVIDIYRSVTAGYLFSGALDPARRAYSESDEVASYNNLMGCQGSAYEHGVIDKYFGSLGAISTMRIFHMAKDRGDSLIEIRSDNYQSVLSSVVLEHEAQGANISNSPTPLVSDSMDFFKDSILGQFENGSLAARRPGNMAFLAPKFYQFYSKDGFKLESAGLAPIPAQGQMGGLIQQKQKRAFYRYSAAITPAGYGNYVVNGDLFGGISTSEVGEDVELALTVQPNKFDVVNNGVKLVKTWKINGTPVGGGMSKTIRFNRDFSCTAGGVKVNLGAAATATITVEMDDPKLPTPEHKFEDNYGTNTASSYTTAYVRTPIVGAMLSVRSPISTGLDQTSAPYPIGGWVQRPYMPNVWEFIVTTQTIGYTSSQSKRQVKISKDGWRESDIREVGTGKSSGVYSNP